MEISKRFNRVLNKPYWHRNLTLGKLISFAAVNGIGTVVFLGAQVFLVEVVGLHYFPATVLTGGVSLFVKFVVMGTTIYRGKK